MKKVETPGFVRLRGSVALVSGMLLCAALFTGCQTAKPTATLPPPAAGSKPVAGAPTPSLRPGSAPVAASVVAPVVAPVAPVVSPTAPALGAVPTPPLAGGATAGVAVTPARAARVAPRIGLALGGGAARGFAHIGVIQALEEAGIKPDMVVGTSAGSLVAALLASGKTGAELSSLALTMDESTLTDWAYPGRGVLRGEALARFVRLHTQGLAIEQMRLPLGIVATELASGAGVLFQRGDTGAAVRASSAVPAVFQPVKIGELEYVDGGLVAPVPVRYARQMGATFVIAVDISTPPEAGTTGDVLKLLLQTFSIMAKSLNRFELREAEVVIQPPLVGVSGADFSARLRAIRSGRDTATAQMPDIKARLLAWERSHHLP
jgi:NTE family protein